MLHLLFEDLPAILFTPVSIGAVIGMVLAAYRARKKRGIFFVPVAFAIALMLGWRLLFPSLMVSARYSAFLTFPAAILTAWASFQLRSVFRLILKARLFSGIPYRHLFCRLVPGLFIAGISVAALIKDMRFNPYRDHTQRLCLAFQADSKGRTGPFCLYSNGEKECGRIGYFCGLPPDKVIPFRSQDPASASTEEIRDRLLYLKNIPGTHYFFVQRLAKLPPVTAKDAGADEPGEDWGEVARVFTSKRKNRVMILYRYVPVCPNFETYGEKSLPPGSGNSLCPNGGFETAMSGRPLEGRLAYYRKEGLKKYSEGTFPIPDLWWLDLTRENAADPPDIRMDDKAPLEGKYSLRMTPGGNSPAKVNPSWLPGKPDGAGFSLFVRGEGNEPVRFQVVPAFKNKTKKLVELQTPLVFLLPPDRICRIRGTFQPSPSFPTEKFTLILTADGPVTADQVEILPAAPQEKEQRKEEKGK